jgi:hypothetical protein
MDVASINFGAVNKAFSALGALALDPELAGQSGPENVNGWMSDAMVKNIQKTCQGCGIPFIAGRRDKVFHSQECKNDWHQRRLAALKAPSELEAALDLALRLTRARAPEAVEARRAVFTLLSAEFAPVVASPTPVVASPTPVVASPTPANDDTDAGELAAAPALDVDALCERVQRVLAGDNAPSQKAIAAAIEADPSTFSRWLKGKRALNSDSLEALERYLTEHERSLKPS